MIRLFSVGDGQIRRGIAIQHQTDLADAVQETAASACSMQQRFHSAIHRVN